MRALLDPDGPDLRHAQGLHDHADVVLVGLLEDARLLFCRYRLESSAASAQA